MTYDAGNVAVVRDHDLSRLVCTCVNISVLSAMCPYKLILNRLLKYFLNVLLSCSNMFWFVE